MENLFKIYFICQPDQENVKEHNMRIVQELQKPPNGISKQKMRIPSFYHAVLGLLQF